MSLIRLTENYSIGPQNAVKKTQNIIEGVDGSRLVEDASGIRYKCYGVYDVNVSRYNYMNENGREYPKELWEKVIKDQREAWDGGVGLANHPMDENDGDVQKIFGVWKNLRLSEDGYVKSDLYLVGPPGKHASEILEAGGRIGFSSSGFGELEEGNKTRVNPNTYILERVSDWVLNPSQRVYGNINNKKADESIIVKESTDSNIQPIQEERITMGVKMSLREERGFIEDTERWLSEANTEKDLYSKKEFLEEVLSYFPDTLNEKMTELKTKVTTRLTETVAKIEKAVKEYTKIEESLEIEGAEKLEEGITNILVETKLQQRDATEWKAIAEGMKEQLQKERALQETLPTVEAYQKLFTNNKKITEIFASKETQLLGHIKELDEKLTEEQIKSKSILEQAREIWEKKQILTDRLTKTMQVAESLKAKLDKIREEDEATDMAPSAGPDGAGDGSDITAEGVINIRPKNAPPKMFESFNESKKVASYYRNLALTYGKEEMEPFKERIVNCKTVDEASRVFLKIFAEFDSKATTRMDDAVMGEARRLLVEKQTGKRIINTQTPLELRKPKGWE